MFHTAQQAGQAGVEIDNHRGVFAALVIDQDIDLVAAKAFRRAAVNIFIFLGTKEIDIVENILDGPAPDRWSSLGRSALCSLISVMATSTTELATRRFSSSSSSSASFSSLRAW